MGATATVTQPITILIRTAEYIARRRLFLALSLLRLRRAERTLILHRPPPDICDVVTCPPSLPLPKRDTVDIEKHGSHLL